MKYTGPEKSSCGVGFIASKQANSTHDILKEGLHALNCVEHRGACGADQLTGDGAGIMTDIPFKLFGYKEGTIAVASLLMPTAPERKRIALKVFENTFSLLGLEVIDYRNVPINPDVLGQDARESMPAMIHAVIRRPEYCRTDFSFDKLLHRAKQLVRIKEKEAGIVKEFYFASLSARTIVYKALTRGVELSKFYLDLTNPDYKTRFCLFHRRFSTNTRTSWDKAQPFRLIGHNGEINTIASNRSWGISRGKALDIQKDQLLTHDGISDSGSFNEMVEALRYRSGVPHVEDILAMMVPPANEYNDYYKFWSRAVEPWDGPALIVYSDGANVGARLDRNGFRPCRWAETEDYFYLSSEAGSFIIDESAVVAKGSLNAGSGVCVGLKNGKVYFRDPSHSVENDGVRFNARLKPIQSLEVSLPDNYEDTKRTFNLSKEEMSMVIFPMIEEGKEAIGSMGDTARLAVLSDQPRSFYDYFYQNFAQVTNPPLDYLREKNVTDLSMYLGKKPNVFEPKELLPPTPAFELKSPVLSLGHMAFLKSLEDKTEEETQIRTKAIDITFERVHGVVGARNKLLEIESKAVEAALSGVSVLILSDRAFSYDRPALPALLALRAAVNALNRTGCRLNTSIVIEAGEVKSTHDFAALISFGAAAVCPYLMLEVARYERGVGRDLDEQEKEANVINALEQGLLKIMAKMGISVVKSYQSSKLFTAIGLGPKLIKDFFPGLKSPIAGYELEHIIDLVLKHTEHLSEPIGKRYKPINTYQYKEHAKGTEGERHSMTRKRSLIVHELVKNSEGKLDLDNIELYNEYLKNGAEEQPVNIRHLFKLKEAEASTNLSEVQEASEIAKKFGSGAMSFGAISAESQRDIFQAFKELGGRSNSGEGGENPYYYSNGISARAKQVASGRFGVNAEYLIVGDEIQIKISQGAKPGEGGQLMGVKVNEDIARARFANPGISLISPPPLHDIYSIEDLKELIYELKQVNPKAKVCVKLVAGANIGTIAVGVAKAGADVIHVSGGDGGTGAASLSSMKHAGLPWELGLFEVHQALIENNLRDSVMLRTDGGLTTGTDIVMAAILGAEEYDFGKMLLISEGCVMARVCEKNTCPAGIATHDPKFKAKYDGNKDKVKAMMLYIAEDARRKVAAMGLNSIEEAVGRVDLLELNPKMAQTVHDRFLHCAFFFDGQVSKTPNHKNLFSDSVSLLNQKILSDTEDAIAKNESVSKSYDITVYDRATLATLAGKMGKLMNEHRKANNWSMDVAHPYTSTLNLEFKGSAGQGFGVFLTDGIKVNLFGEANDSVAKGMSGGTMVINPPKVAKFKPHENTIIGNVALYGATGGKLFVNGLAGDRFAVRNSGATAVVEGVGLHACEYMTNGKIVILGKVSHNLGGGMTGGEVIVFGDSSSMVNNEYISEVALTDEDYTSLKALLEEYVKETNSEKWSYYLKDWDNIKGQFKRYIPIPMLKKINEASVAEKS